MFRRGGLVRQRGEKVEGQPLDEKGEDVYAFSLWPDWDNGMVMYVKSMASAYYGLDEMELGLYDTNTGTFYGALKEQGPYLELLRFLMMYI